MSRKDILMSFSNVFDEKIVHKIFLSFIVTFCHATDLLLMWHNGDIYFNLYHHKKNQQTGQQTAVWGSGTGGMQGLWRQDHMGTEKATSSPSLNCSCWTQFAPNGCMCTCALKESLLHSILLCRKFSVH